MAKIRATASFGEASAYESLHVELDREDVQENPIPAVTRKVPTYVDGDDGTEPVQALDPETGAPLFHDEEVTPARWESLDEALVRVLGEYIHVEEVETSGITHLTVTVQYSGEVELELDEYELGRIGSGLTNPSDLTEALVLEVLEDDIHEAIREDIGWGADISIDYEYAE